MATLLRTGERCVDPAVKSAIESIQSYSLAHAADTVSDVSWWSSFEDFYTGVVKRLDDRQAQQVEMAADALLVDAGMRSWSLARVALHMAHPKGHH